MKLTKYLSKSGKYAGMWHVRAYMGGRYFHIGRFRTIEEANNAMERA